MARNAQAIEIVSQAIAEATPDSPESIDRAFELSAKLLPGTDPVRVLQSLAIREGTVPGLLREQARDRGESLCPKCLGPIPVAMVPLPPPAVYKSGRIASQGAVVEVVETPLARKVLLAFPEEKAFETGVFQYRPRVRAVAVTAIWLILFSFGLLFWPRAWFNPFALGFLLTWLGWSIYFLLRWRRRRWPTREKLAFDTAWRDLIPKLDDPELQLRFCRASFGRGGISERSKALRKMIERAAEESNPNSVNIQLLAVARVLQVLDGSELGKEKVAGLWGLFEPVFQGDLPAGFAEAASECLISSGELAAGDLLRLRLLQMAGAFEAKFGPVDLFALARVFPSWGKLLKPETLEEAKFAYAIWRGAPANSTELAGVATSFFELARNSPTLSRKLLAQWPDALLRIVLPEHLQSSLSVVILTPKGLVIDDHLIDEDVGEEIDVKRSPSGSGWFLMLGVHRIAVDRKLPLKVAEALASWLSYRTRKLLPLVERVDKSNPAKVRRMLAPYAVECPHCRSVSLGRLGNVGVPLDVNFL